MRSANRPWIRSRIWASLGSRSLSTVTSGAARNTEEYAPMTTPTIRANAKSFSVSPPNSSRDVIGSTTTSEVFTDRMKTSFSESFTTPA